MPPLAGGQYMLDYLFEIGPVKGEGPIDMPELMAWERALGIEWAPWQSRLIIRLSRAYLGEMHRATKRDAEPPWHEAVRMWKWVQQKLDDRRLDAFV